MDRITIKTTVAADRKKAWDYWTLPQHIVNWNFASDDWHCPNASNDLQTGGKFSATMASKDGKMSFEFEGVYDEVTDQKKITYKMPDGRRVEVAFAEADGKTTIVETFDPESTNPVEMQRQGWQAILDNFKIYVESN